MQKEAGTDFRLCIEAGNVSSIVAEVARKDEADLVLIGRGVLPHFGEGCVRMATRSCATRRVPSSVSEDGH
jgi:hypothetical protein